MRARGATPSLPSPRSSSQRRRAPATTAMRTSFTVPPTVLRTRWTSSRSTATPAVRRVPVGSATSASDERVFRLSRPERATDAPMSRARPTSERAPRTSPGSLRTSGKRPVAGCSGRGRGLGRSRGSMTPAARVRARSPSARAWWNLNSTAKEVPSSPGSTWASHGGRPRSSERSMSASGLGVEVGGRGVQPDVVERVEVRRGSRGWRPRRPAGAGAARRRGSACAVRVRRRRGRRAGRPRGLRRWVSGPRRHRGRPGAWGAGRSRCSRTPGRGGRAGPRSQRSRDRSRVDDG